MRKNNPSLPRKRRIDFREYCDNMRIVALNFLVVLLVHDGLSQNSFLPQNLGTAVNSQYHDINPALSPDNQTLYFVRVNHPENTFGEKDSEDIWFCQLQAGGTWSTAQRIPALNIGRYNAVLSVSNDGKTLLINGIFDKKGTIWKKRGLSISMLIGDSWNTPERIKIRKYSKRNRGMKSSSSLSSDGTVLILSFSRTYNSNRSDIFVSHQFPDLARWSKPKKIKSLSTKFSEDTPFLSADKKIIYFASDRILKEKFDIYKSKRTTDSWQDWDEPTLLNDTINSTEWESYFKTNIKGSFAYFSSTKNSVGKADIFKIKLFEENPFVIVSGNVYNAKTKKPLADKPFKIAINGTTVDSLSIQQDSAQYTARLPLRKMYTVSAKADNYFSKPDTVDVTHIREFTEMKRDLFVTPYPYVKVYGNLFIKHTKTPIPATAHPEVYVNNGKVDSLEINLTLGTYSVKLPHGRTYNLQIRADKFDPIPYTLDLTSIDEYQEVSADLFADEEKMALITGTIMDKKTSKPLLTKSKVSLKVEGEKSIIAGVDSVTSRYELKLLPGHIYTISANVPDYYPIYETIDLLKERENIRINKDLIIVPIEVGQSIRLNNIFFESGKAVLKKESFEELNRVIEFLNANPDIKIEIAGHTDNVGKAQINMKLSQSRANSVTKYMISKGVSTSRITAKGYGITKPVAANKTAQGRSQNRRVEFTILDK